MTLDTNALDHICSVVRRGIQEELPDLSLLYIVHNTEGRPRALATKMDELLDHPAGPVLMPLLKKMAEGEDQHSAFAGVAFGESKSLFGLRTRKLAMGVFFINSDEFNDPNDAREFAYNAAWHSLSVVQKFKNMEMDAITETHGILRPKHSPVIMARQNMLADVFAAVMMERQGHRKSIDTLAYRRSLMALQPIPKYKAEQFPFPVTADAVRIVLEEIKEFGATSTKPVAVATEITNEIDYTYDDASIRQWWEFSTSAQELAWLNFDKNRILGTAIYTSEDPYVRSTAYLVAEALNMEPAALSDLGAYNPFTDQEVNERLHAKACDESFHTLLNSLTLDFNEHILMEEVRKQNARLMEGYPIGWCGHAVLVANDAIESAREQGQNPIEKARQGFQQGCKDVAWEALRTVCRMVMNRRRDGDEITPEMIIEFCQDKPGLAPIGDTFATVPQDTSGPLTAAKKDTPKKEKKMVQGNFSQYTAGGRISKGEKLNSPSHPSDNKDKS